MTAKNSFYSSCFTFSLHKHLSPGFKLFFRVAGGLLSVTITRLRVVNFSAVIHWDSLAICY